MRGESERTDAAGRYKVGPQVARSSKETRRYTKRVIFVFIICVAVLIAVITAQTHYKREDTRVPEREKSYRAPQPSGFAELAVGLRRERVSVQAEVKRESEETQGVIVTRATERKLIVPAASYYSDRNDAQGANTLRTLKLQALTSRPEVENFELKRNDEAGVSQQRTAVANTTTSTSGIPSVMDSSALAALM